MICSPFDGAKNSGGVKSVLVRRLLFMYALGGTSRRELIGLCDMQVGGLSVPRCGRMWVS